MATAIALPILLLLLLAGRRPSATTLNAPLALYLAFSALAFLVGPLKADSLRRLTTLLLGVVIFHLLFRWLRNRPDRLRSAVQVLSLLAALIALLSPFAMEWPSRHLLDLTFLTARIPRLSGPVTIHHNQVAGLLVLLLPLTLVAYKESPTQLWRRLSAVSAAAVLLTLALTQSRNAWLALLVAGLGVLLWQRRRFMPLMALLLLLLLLPFAFAQLPPSSPLAPPLDQIDASTKTGPATNKSWLGRVEMWSAAVSIMSDYPLLGAGLYTFEPVSRANYVYETVRLGFPISHAHNLFLHTGAGLGWPGWLAIVLLLFTLIYTLWQSARRAPTPWSSVGRALGASLLAYLSFNTWDMLAFEQRAGLLIWPLLALAAACSAAGPSRLLRQQHRTLRLLSFAPLALFLLLLPTLPRNLAHLRLDHARLGDGDADQLEPELMGDPRRRGLGHHLQAQPASALSHWAQDHQAVPFLTNQGQQDYLDGQAAAAIDWYNQALTLQPTAATTHYWRGLAYETLGESERALADYTQTIALAAGETLYDVPLEAVAWDRRGRLLAQQSSWQAAAEAFARASTLAPQQQDYRQRLHDVRQLLPDSEQD